MKDTYLWIKLLFIFTGAMIYAVFGVYELLYGFGILPIHFEYEWWFLALSFFALAAYNLDHIFNIGKR